MIVTTGARVVPTRLDELGYEFRRPDLEAALRDATGRSRSPLHARAARTGALS